MIKRKRFSVVISDRNQAQIDKAIEACIKRYETKTGRFVSKNGRCVGNLWFRYHMYAYTCNTTEELKKLAETYYGPEFSIKDYTQQEIKK